MAASPTRFADNSVFALLMASLDAVYFAFRGSFVGQFGLGKKTRRQKQNRSV
jgi:hypothetical protein